MKLATCERVIAAPVDVVWRLISTADGLTEWMCEEASVDLREGGTITWRHDNGWVVAGKFREIVPMRRLAYTYGWAQGGFPVPLDLLVAAAESTASGLTDGDRP